jgi:beta-lactamase superfamily II metal-dependent hydrolase
MKEAGKRSVAVGRIDQGSRLEGHNQQRGMNRRRFLKLATATGLSGAIPDYAANSSQTLEPWKPGTLDIHHLAYGRGSSTFVLCPDGTTMLIDAGTTEDALAVSCAQKVDTDKRPGEWIASYILRQMISAGRQELDYVLLTHIHPDHIGDLGPENPQSAKGSYRLTGIMDVDTTVPIRRLIDRGFPDYSYPVAVQAPFARNYVQYVQSRQRLGECTERIRAGSAKQIHLVRSPGAYPGFIVRNLAANGEVWTGSGENTRTCFPELKDLRPADYPTENMCSIAIRLSYGKFDYFAGGDLTSDTEESGELWRDIETPVARVAGPVDVAVANHHAYFDAVGPEFVRALRPKIFIVSSWYVAHPSVLPLRRMLSMELYKEDREIYATCVMEANRIVNNQFISKLKSMDGHLIVRVAEGGEEFRVIVTDNSDNSDRIKAISGPYRCQ